MRRIVFFGRAWLTLKGFFEDDFFTYSVIHGQILLLFISLPNDCKINIAFDTSNVQIMKSMLPPAFKVIVEGRV
jgi:hypothetical protein